MLDRSRRVVIARLSNFLPKSGTNAKQEHSASKKLSAIAVVDTVLGHHPRAEHPDPYIMKCNVLIHARFPRDISIFLPNIGLRKLQNENMGEGSHRQLL